MKTTLILLGLVVAVWVPPVMAGDGATPQPMPLTAVNPSNLINGTLMADYPSLPGPVVPPLPAPEDPEYGIFSYGSTRSALLGGSAAIKAAMPALQGGGSAISAPRSSNLTVDPQTEGRRSLKKLIRDLG